MGDINMADDQATGSVLGDAVNSFSTFLTDKFSCWNCEDDIRNYDVVVDLGKVLHEDDKYAVYTRDITSRGGEVSEMLRKNYNGQIESPDVNVKSLSFFSPGAEDSLNRYAAINGARQIVANAAATEGNLAGLDYENPDSVRVSMLPEIKEFLQRTKDGLVDASLPEIQYDEDGHSTVIPQENFDDLTERLKAVQNAIIDVDIATDVAAYRADIEERIKNSDLSYDQKENLISDLNNDDVSANATFDLKIR